ncbi:MAG: hypothetical protein ABJC63_16735, partial [Gemmatimonadales bacterium]
MRERRPLSALDLFEAAKLQRWVRRSWLVQNAGLLSMRGLQRIGVQTWGTKSFEFWTLLASALWLVRPRSIVELGSGRSTQYLADYAMKESVPFISIEQSAGWARRVKRGLSAALVTPDVVHHVPLGSQGWYDVERLDALVRFECDCLFVDGPVGSQESLGRGARDGEVARRWLTSRVRPVRLLVVDDVHRDENLSLLRLLVAEAGCLEPLFLSYRPGKGSLNVAALALEQSASANLLASCDALGIAIVREWPEPSEPVLARK